MIIARYGKRANMSIIVLVCISSLQICPCLFYICILACFSWTFAYLHIFFCVFARACCICTKNMQTQEHTHAGGRANMQICTKSVQVCTNNRYICIFFVHIYSFLLFAHFSCISARTVFVYFSCTSPHTFYVFYVYRGKYISAFGKRRWRVSGRRTVSFLSISIFNTLNIRNPLQVISLRSSVHVRAMKTPRAEINYSNFLPYSTREFT